VTEPPTPPSGPPAAGDEPDPGALGRKVAGAKGMDLVLLVAGTLFLIATFLPWYRTVFTISGRTFVQSSDGAWGSGGLGALAALCGIGAGAVALVVATGSKSLSQQSAGLLAFVLAASAFFFTLVRLIVRPTGSGEIEEATRGVAQIQRGFGLWLAVVLTIVMTFAGYRKYREHAV
jgi:hypothetical protein